MNVLLSPFGSSCGDAFSEIQECFVKAISAAKCHGRKKEFFRYVSTNMTFCLSEIANSPPMMEERWVSLCYLLLLESLEGCMQRAFLSVSSKTRRTPKQQSFGNKNVRLNQSLL